MHRCLSTGPATIAALMAVRHAGPATPRDTAPLATLRPDLARPGGHARRAARNAAARPGPAAPPHPAATTP